LKDRRRPVEPLAKTRPVLVAVERKELEEA
jgi:hypothetical protein